MFIGGMGGAGIAFGTSFALSLRSLGRTRGGTSDFPLSPEVYDAFERFKKGQVHYNYYLDEEKRVQDVIGKAENSLKEASFHAPRLARKEDYLVAPSSHYIRSLYTQYRTLTGHLQEVQDLAMTFTMQPYRPKMPMSEKISSALNGLLGPGDQDNDSSSLIEKINKQLNEQKSKLAKLVDTASKMAEKEKQVIELIVRTFRVNRENYQALGECAAIFPELKDSFLVWTRNLEHVDAIARLKKEAVTPRDMVNCLWEPMTHIVAATVATGKEQDIDLTLRTFQANMKIHTDMVDLAPAIMQNRVGNQDILTMLSSLKQAQSEDMNPLAYRHAEKDVRHYFSKIVQQDYTNVLSEHKKFIESNLYADAFGLLNRLNEGLDSQNDFDLLSDENPRLTMALHAYILCFNDIQIISATGLNGEKPEAFDALLNAVGTGLSQRNARIESLAVVSQNVGSSLQM